MAALMRKFQKKIIFVLIHNRCLGCQETKFLVPFFPTVKYSAGQMLHIVRNVINFTKAYGNKIKMKAGQITAS